MCVTINNRCQKLLWWGKAYCRNTDHGLSQRCWRRGLFFFFFLSVSFMIHIFSSQNSIYINLHTYYRLGLREYSTHMVLECALTMAELWVTSLLRWVIIYKSYIGLDLIYINNNTWSDVMQALRKEPMTVYGDGKQTRSFQFVSDLVSSIFSFFMKLLLHKKLDHH